MFVIQCLKQIGIIILVLIIIPITLAVDQTETVDSINIDFSKIASQTQPILTAYEIDGLIQNLVITNTHIKSANEDHLNYYDMYFVISGMYRDNISNLLKITEPPQEEQEEIENINDDGQLIVNIKLNYEDIYALATIYKKQDDILFPLKELLSYDMNQEYLDHGQNESINNITYISLKSLPLARFQLNDETQILELNFPPGGMINQHFDANTHSTVGEFSKPANGAFLNYDVTLTNTKNSRTMTGIQEFNAFTTKGSGTNSMLVRKNLNGKNTKTHIQRLESYWITENENDLTRWTFGDSTTYAAPWSGSTRFGGVQYSSNFNIRSGIITRPLIDFNGMVESPSDITVFSNSQQIYKGAAKTGNFDIDNLPITTGSGDLVVKLKDITGKIQTIVIPYYNTPELLTPGLTSFSYAIGKQRRRFSIESNRYKNNISSFDYMHGIDNNWTAGGHFESWNNVVSTGFTSVNKLGLYGVIQTSLANTYRNKLNAQRGQFEYSFQGKKWSFFTGLTLDRGGFLDTFNIQPEYVSKGLSKSYQTSIGYGDDKLGSFFVTYNSTRVIDKNSVSTINFLNGSYSKEITKNSTMRFNCGTNLRKNKEKEIHVSISYTLNLDDKNIYTGLSKRSKNKSISKDIGISSPSSTQLGWGYSANFKQDDKLNNYDININKSSEIMNTSLYFFDFNKIRSEQVSFTGSVTEIDNSIYFSRPIDNSLALVKTSSFKNIPIYNNNHLIGKTNSQGNLLISNLIPYYPSEVRMDANKVPLDAKFTYLNMYATPRWKSGTIMNFDITKQRSLQMKMLDSSNNPLEVNRALKIDGIADEITVGYNGMVYIENIKDLDDITGTSCDDDNKCCSFSIPLNIYEKDDIIDLGDEICK